MNSSKKSKVFYFLLLWRLVSVFVVQTAHVPDEYWQSVEVAHNLAFGYGFLTWEWSTRIRSYIYPFIISIVYRILALLSLDYVPLLTTVPRIIQAVISAYSEYRFYLWTGNKWTLYSICLNWYWYYCATRTMANTIETAGTMLALSIFPWRDSNVRSINFLWIVGFLCMIRPTAAIIWIPMCLYHFCTSQERKIVLAFRYFLIGIICILLSVLLDSYCYGTFVITPWEFFRTNVLFKVGELFGKQHTLWYIFSGLPVLLGLYYPISILCSWHVMQYPAKYHRQAVMLTVIIWTVGIYSMLSHKEFRFILPLLPMILYICTSCTFKFSIRFSNLTKKIFVALLVITNVFPGLYFCVIHQRGSLDVMEVLRKDISKEQGSDILFLTPCHGTPLYSHMHVNVSTKILTCAPNFDSSFLYMDESDTFFADPMHWLISNYDMTKQSALPTHIILFDSLLPKIQVFLEKYKILDKIFHAHFTQSNYGKYVYVYKRKDIIDVLKE